MQFKWVDFCLYRWHDRIIDRHPKLIVWYSGSQLIDWEFFFTIFSSHFKLTLLLSTTIIVMVYLLFGFFTLYLYVFIVICVYFSKFIYICRYEYQRRWAGNSLLYVIEGNLFWLEPLNWFFFFCSDYSHMKVAKFD